MNWRTALIRSRQFYLPTPNRHEIDPLTNDTMRIPTGHSVPAAAPQAKSFGAPLGPDPTGQFGIPSPTCHGAPGASGAMVSVVWPL